ncbi:uncharacterized protein LOC106013234 [Aplysia californica]|uniref:Uncharacterized protein LOC106013234 n=1 Tax=Aplysia californica TaxID=6500 RepID=A0ABM1AA92_APLCA|nr:uncharacterized protein LOC106013234 [Aplysia californica]
MNADLPGLGIPTLVLPWVVMQELDFIKDSRKRRDRYNEMTWRRAVEAVHFIHAKLNTKDQNLIGQPPKEAYQKTDMVISSNDDRILQCCVQWKEKCPDDHVILLSRDLNLTNKSVIMGISAANTETLWNELKMPKPNLKLLQKPPSNETTQKGNQNVAATSGKSKNSEGSHVKQLFLSEPETTNQKQLPVRYNKATTKVNSTDAPPSLLSLPCQQPVNSSRNVYNNPTLQKTCVPGISAPSTEDRPASLSNTQENLNQVAKNVTHKPTSKHLQPQSSSNWDKTQEQTSVCFVESSQSVSSSSGVVPGTRTERVQSDEPMESATESASGNTGKNLDPTSEPARELRATQSETASPAASVTECESLVLSKFQNIWTFITEFRDELIKVLNEGQSHAEFPMAVAALRRVGSLMIELMEKFTECLDLSPVILQDRQLEFKAFAECLNNFLLRTEVNVTKTTPPLDHRQLIGYFSATKSRPQLKAGLEELSGFIKLFQEMSGQIFAAASS